MTEFNWIVTAMDCYPTVGSETNIVFIVHWTCNGTDGIYRTAVGNTCSVPLVDGILRANLQQFETEAARLFPAVDGSFTPYSSLTQEQVLGWCWANGVSKDATEAAVEAQLFKIKEQAEAQVPKAKDEP